LRVAQFLLDNGARVNFEYAGGGTPLAEAAAKGQNAMVKFLLDHNADVEAGNDRMTPLLIAVEHRYKAVTETLLAYHANVNAKSNTGIQHWELPPRVIIWPSSNCCLRTAQTQISETHSLRCSPLSRQFFR
jgi:ankyrin repeat protein